ncbi:MAG: type II secretion system F family protein [Planctomycetes bacterium]|nr:type II secretion system F family protein [Planctomycetota bacterium]
MKTATLDDLMALNDQFMALVEAGVPVDAGLGMDAAASLEKINATVARRVSRGESLSESLEDDEHDVPDAYRCLVQLGIHSGNVGTAWDESNLLAETVDSSRYAVRSALFYPILVCAVAYVGLIGFCLYFVPTLEEFYRDLRIPPGSGLRALQFVRNTMPYWIVLPPLALLLLAAWWFRTRSRGAMSNGRVARVLAWVPGISRAISQQRYASFSESLATLLERGVSLEESLDLAAGVSGDAGLNQGACALVAGLEQGQMPPDDSAAARRFPPFLRWSLWHSEATIGRVPALRMAARVYRHSAERRAERLRIVAPIVACVLIGGGVTLLYGLMLFIPVVQMLRSLAS